VDNRPRPVDNLGTLGTVHGASSLDTRRRSPRHATLCVVSEYDPDRDGELLPTGDVARLLHVHRNHVANLRKAGVLRGWKMHEHGHWRYPSHQPVLDEARAALRQAGRP
jgi:hypothetical protein